MVCAPYAFSLLFLLSTLFYSVSVCLFAYLFSKEKEEEGIELDGWGGKEDLGGIEGETMIKI